ncbi:sodium-dependent lysophosphatidylcholine symporter 1-B-like [Echeneis naucrates]|uniref:sodium-dependent lysophosphatidylcholine symporter 1-B-like n=1 Tax=Echeneis naucrates TaxID=173247 RepID=UPI0011146071|nr:sodium-dependent lysophosphatidylcholine symporter 1-like [Echeneis naucrates]
MSRFQEFTHRLQVFKNLVIKQNAGRNGEDQTERWLLRSTPPPSCLTPPMPSQGSGGIPLARKLCYAVGGVPYQLTAAAMGISLQIFLLDVVKIQASYVAMILLVSRAWDAVTDPLVGYLVSRSKRTPIGKLSPWLVLSTPLGVLSYLLLWFQPPGCTSQPLSVLWFLTATCLFETLMSCYNVPYLSLNMFLGGDQRDRDSATAYRMSAEMAAVLVASVIQGQVMAVYNAEKQESCQQMDQPPQSTSSTQTASLQETQKAFLTSALVMGALFFLCSLALFLGVKEQQTPLCSADKVRPSCLSSLKLLIGHVPYRRLVLGFVFSALAIQMSWSNFALFCTHAAGLGAEFQYLLLALLASASIAVPVWHAVLVRVGKKSTALIGLSLFMPAAIIVACVPSNLPVVVIMCILMGCSVATVFLLPWSMLPDVVDDFAVRHPSCKDLEPLFFSCYAFCSKLAGGLSVGISAMILQFAGYRAGACKHADGVVTALIVLFSPVPVALLLMGMVCFCFYPIDERQLHKQLTAVHPEASPPPSSSSSHPKKNAEQPTAEQPHAGVSSTSHHNFRTKTNSPPCCSNHNNKCPVKSSAHSDVPRSRSAEHSRPKSAVGPHVKRQHHEQRLSPRRRSGEPRLGGLGLFVNVPQSSSSRSNVKSKVSWV